MLVSRITGDCPRCHSERSFGNVSIMGNLLLQGCRKCDYDTHRLLPELRKKIIYLDQNVFSLAYRGNQPAIAEGAKRLAQLSSLQLVVVPYSSVHEDEAQFFREHAELMAFIKEMAHGHAFQPRYGVERAQVYQAFDAFVRGEPAQCPLVPSHALPRDVHCWDNYLRIEMPSQFFDTVGDRTRKEQTVAALVTELDHWSQSNATWEEDMQLELADAGEQTVDAYMNLLQRTLGSPVARLKLPVSSFHQLLLTLPGDHWGEENLLKVKSFFASEHFARVPHQQLFARLFATFKAQVRRGAYPNREEAPKRLSGLFHDVWHAATYAPYCDAYVTDRAMAELMRHPKVHLERDYGCQVFSLSNWDQFLVWLEDIEKSVTTEHLQALNAAYPPAPTNLGAQPAKC